MTDIKERISPEQIKAKAEQIKKVKLTLIDAILRNGEGRQLLRIPGEKTYYEETGKRFWDPVPETLKQSKCKVEGHEVFKMDSTNPQVDAYYIDGEVYITHSGYERTQINKMLDKFKCGFFK